MQSNKKIALTGGGTGGHVMPNIAIYEELKKRNFDIIYIGSENGIEKEIIKEYNIPFFSVHSGKLRRYHDFHNFLTPFNVLRGIEDAKKILIKEKVNLLFSKGGFVAVPCVIASNHLKIPVISHEADFSLGLANKIALPFSDIMCTNFKETAINLKSKKAIYTGCPIRKNLLSGDRDIAKEYFHFKEEKPVILIIGGSLGSLTVNKIIRNNIHTLLPYFNIIHSCGKGKTDNTFQTYENDKIIYKYDGYRQFELITDMLPHIYQYSNIVISRAGANVIFELLNLKKPNLLIPLGLNASRGDQILNAKSFKEQGFSEYLLEEDILKDNKIFLNMLKKLYDDKKYYIKNMENATLVNATDRICDIICKYTNKTTN